MLPLLNRLLNATTALLVSGVYGALIGFVVAMVIGFVFGSVVGIPFGFAAAVLGTALGNRRGWMFSGGLMGLISGVLVYSGMVGHWPGNLGELAWILYLSFVPMLCGIYVSSKAERRLNASKARFPDFLRPLRKILLWSRLYDLSIKTRVLLALVLLALELIAMWRLLAPRNHVILLETPFRGTKKPR